MVEAAALLLLVTFVIGVANSETIAVGAVLILVLLLLLLILLLVLRSILVLEDALVFLVDAGTGAGADLVGFGSKSSKSMSFSSWTGNFLSFNLLLATTVAVAVAAGSCFLLSTLETLNG